MSTAWNEILWGQFGAALEMLENAMLACPNDLWSDRSKKPECCGRIRVRRRRG